MSDSAAPKPTDHPEFSPAEFFFREFQPLAQQVAALAARVAELGDMYQQALEDNALLSLEADGLRDEIRLLQWLADEHNQRLKVIETDRTPRSLVSRSIFNAKPGGPPNGPVLQHGIHAGDG